MPKKTKQFWCRECLGIIPHDYKEAEGSTFHLSCFKCFFCKEGLYTGYLYQQVPGTCERSEFFCPECVLQIDKKQFKHKKINKRHERIRKHRQAGKGSASSTDSMMSSEESQFEKFFGDRRNTQT
eukprot:256173_1